MFFQSHTKLHLPKNTTGINISNIYEWELGTGTRQTTNILGLVVVATAWGIAIAQLGEQARIMAMFFDNILTISMKITQWVIFMSPLGITFIVTSEIMGMDDMATVMKSLGFYFATVLIGLGIQGFVILPLLFFLLTRRNPFPFVKNLSEAVITGFGTASR